MKLHKLLITGAHGQLGQALQAQFSGHEVIAWDIQDLDICELEAVRKALSHIRPDVVLNAAAFTQVDQAETNQETAYRGNALGPRNLAIATNAMNIPLVHFSTDYVFDGRQTRPYHEFDRPNPLSVYGQSKLAGEEEVQKRNPRHFMIRTAWLYHVVGKNFPQTICRLANQKQVRVVRDQFGSPTFAPHLARAVSRLIETESYGTYHLAGSGGTSWYDFTKSLYHARGIHTPVVPITTAEYPLPAPRPAFAVLTSLQDPSIVLPPWEEGVRDFAAQWKGTGL
jgi:dTDP-4-dehydrorhamnose reductase